MNRTKLNVMMMGLLLLYLCATSTVRAEGARSYVSISGSDNRPCSRNQPCRSFDAALAKTDAGGEIIALDTGTYEPTTITKAITLAAAPGVDAGIRASAGSAVTIEASSFEVVILRGLRLVGPGKNMLGTNGVLVNIVSPNCCLSVRVENCFISDFEKGIQMDVGVGAHLSVNETVLRANKVGLNLSVGGIEDDGAAVDRSRFENNEVGLLAFTGNSVSVSNSIATRNGIAFQTDPGGNLDIFNSVVAKNSRGVNAQGGNIRLAYCSVTGNGWGLITDNGGSIRSMGNNMVVDNYIDIAGANFVTFAAK